MTYTKEFEEWVAWKSCAPLPVSRDALSPDLMKSHFWLSAFAKLVREDAENRCMAIHQFSMGMQTPCCLCTEAALNAICSRFGLIK